MVYAIFRAHITNPGAMAQYREKAAEALARHGGRVESPTPSPTALDGTPDIPDIAALLVFPDRDSALAWINDPDLQELHALRRSSGDTDILLLA